MVITLTGFMGCGKSTVGRRLSKVLSCPFIDLDDYIEEAEGRSITDIFAEEGENGFRLIECRCLEAILRQDHDKLVLALGGGAVTFPASAELIRKHSTCVYLQASKETLLKHLQGRSGRPLLQTGDPLEKRIDTLMAARKSIYEAAADVTVTTDKLTPISTARLIVKELD